jgi:hypothetical protein
LAGLILSFKIKVHNVAAVEAEFSDMRQGETEEKLLSQCSQGEVWKLVHRQPFSSLINT